MRLEEERRALHREVHPENDPQECGPLRQGNIALIHSAPTGESGVRHCERGEAIQSRHSGAMRCIEPGISIFRVWC
jgi:hypothetical protein